MLSDSTAPRASSPCRGNVTSKFCGAIWSRSAVGRSSSIRLEGWARPILEGEAVDQRLERRARRAERPASGRAMAGALVLEAAGRADRGDGSRRSRGRRRRSPSTASGRAGRGAARGRGLRARSGAGASMVRRGGDAAVGSGRHAPARRDAAPPSGRRGAPAGTRLGRGGLRPPPRSSDAGLYQPRSMHAVAGGAGGVGIAVRPARLWAIAAAPRAAPPRPTEQPRRLLAEIGEARRPHALEVAADRARASGRGSRISSLVKRASSFRAVTDLAELGDRRRGSARLRAGGRPAWSGSSRRRRRGHSPTHLAGGARPAPSGSTPSCVVEAPVLDRR